jgi:flagellar biosynthesis/type III secretory pathway protein FliH
VFKKNFSSGFGGITFKDAIPKNYYALFENLKLSEKYGKIEKIMKDDQRRKLELQKQKNLEKQDELTKEKIENAFYSGYNMGKEAGFSMFLFYFYFC